MPAAGNSSAPVIIDIEVDSVAPVIAGIDPANASFLAAAPTQVTVDLTENGSGLDLAAVRPSADGDQDLVVAVLAGVPAVEDDPREPRDGLVAIDPFLVTATGDRLGPALLLSALPPASVQPPQAAEPAYPASTALAARHTASQVSSTEYAFSGSSEKS